MRVLQTRWILVAVLAIASVSNVRGQGTGGGTCEGYESDCELGLELISNPEEVECGNVPNLVDCSSELCCQEPAPPTPAPQRPPTAAPQAPPTPAPQAGATPAPQAGATRAPQAGATPTPTSAAEEEEGLIETDDGDANDREVGTDDGDDGTNGGTNQGDTANASSDSDDGGWVWGITFGTLLGALLLANLCCCWWCLMSKRRKKSSDATAEGVVYTRDGEQFRRLEHKFAEEMARRERAEGLVYRSQGGGGIRPGEFPSVRDVNWQLEQFPTHAINWSDKARAIGGSHRALPATIRSVLMHTFLVCKEEVERCLDGRLRNLSSFLGNNEPVELSELSGADPMNLDTQYVLYECLCRNYRTIVPTDQVRMGELAGIIKQRCADGRVADVGLAHDVIFGEEAWPCFDNLMKIYILVFVEMALQKPRMEFEDDLGMTTAFSPMIHRDWAPFSEAPSGQPCSIVFPAVLAQEGRPESNAKIGVVLLSA